MSNWTRFWELIDLARRQPEAFERELAAMDEAELVEFYWTHEDVVADLKDESHTRYLKPPRTEDFIDDVAQWVVSRGLDYYEDIMTTPSEIPPELPPGEDPPGLTGIASRVYETRFGSSMRFQDEPPPSNLPA